MKRGGVTDKWLGDFPNLFGDLAAKRIAGRCLARETLGIVERTTSVHAFQKIVWGNAQRLLRIPA